MSSSNAVSLLISSRIVTFLFLPRPWWCIAVACHSSVRSTHTFGWGRTGLTHFEDDRFLHPLLLPTKPRRGPRSASVEL
ncbi:hypothetical protein DFH27DRAFT_338724 [Peziza echinospora]|nr:hypothetical protein DFH27DRAFT_338724 [Peziza echinospora]